MTNSKKSPEKIGKMDRGKEDKIQCINKRFWKKRKQEKK